MKTQKTKSVQLDPAVLDKLNKIKIKTGAHSINEVVENLIQGQKQTASLEQRVATLEETIRVYMEGTYSYKDEVAHRRELKPQAEKIVDEYIKNIDSQFDGNKKQQVLEVKEVENDKNNMIAYVLNEISTISDWSKVKSVKLTKFNNVYEVVVDEGGE